MSTDNYWNICQSHTSDTLHYRMLNDTYPSNIVQQRVTQFSKKYKPLLTLKEYNYLTKRKHKISNLYMLPKLMKQYGNNNVNTLISKKILLLKHVPLLLVPFTTKILARDSFDFKNRLDKHCPTRITPGTCDIKSLCTNIRHDIFILQFNTGLKYCKMIYRYCDVSINNLSFRLFHYFRIQLFLHKWNLYSSD